MDTVFGFIDNYYKQLADVAIGSSLEPILMNNFLCHHEKNYLRNCEIAYTPVLSKDKSLGPLDIPVHSCNNKYETSAYCHSTFFGVFTNFKSFIVTVYKSSFISTRTLIYKSFNIILDYHKLHEEILKLKSVPNQIGYQTRFQDKVIGKSLDKSFKK